ncbi:MAG: hypothetical protein BWZ03_00545 [bacterium ADurb.BinA186]|nr:MAG: hypothetical protein BWZ03_00545 [bacterium ADurb.BinA186]
MTKSDFFEAYCRYKIAKHKYRRINNDEHGKDVFIASKEIVDNYHNKELRKKLKISSSFFIQVENDFNTLSEQLQRQVPPASPVVEVVPQIETVPEAPITKSVRFPEALVTAPQLHQSRAGLVKKSADMKRYLVDDYLLDDNMLSAQKQESFLRAVEASMAEGSQNNKFAAQLLSTIADFFALSRDGGNLDKSVRNRAHLIIALGLYVDALKVSPGHESIRAAKNRLLTNQLQAHNVGPIAYRQALAETIDNKPLPLLVQELVAGRLEELSAFLLTKPALVAQTLDKLSDYLSERIVTKNLLDNAVQSRRAQEQFLRAWQTP